MTPTTRDGDADLIAELRDGGTDRFVIQRRIGEGGMGVVYEAYDQERKMRIALKTLRRVDPLSLYRFKREFRLLVDVRHPNLIALHELISVGKQWLFTMEYVDGVDFLSHVCATDATPTPTPPPAHPTARGKRARSGGDFDTLETRDFEPDDHRQPTGTVADLDRLMPALRQLVEGVQALHDTGHLHRDIKPSNILVTPEGRVVLLDFGVITELAGPRWQQETGEFVGTPSYMAPELILEEIEPSAAADWYSVGVVLYRALTGRLPVPGRGLDVLEAKQTHRPSPPRSLRPEVPELLDRVCLGLLQPRIEDRMTGPQLLEALGISRSPASAPVSRRSAAPEVAFVGRVGQLEALHAALVTTQHGHGVTVLVHGQAGLGKSALVRHFLWEVTEDPEVVVLEGRCYERESVPYKALDSLVDSLARHLVALDQRRVEALLPRDIQVLARVFPVLRRVEAVVRAPTRAAPARDPDELKRRAFGALRDLLGRLADHGPLVLWIDDLHWGDLDSVPFLRGLTRPPDAPPLLLVATYRSEQSTAPVIDALLSPDETPGGAAAPQRLEIEPMSAAESAELVSRILGPDAPAGLAGDIAGDARGNPFYILELTRFIEARAGQLSEQRPTLDALVAGRVAELPAGARELLEIIAVAGRPLVRSDAERATEIPSTGRSPLVVLESLNLIRMSGWRNVDVLEVYDNRIREIVVAHLDPETTRHHHLRLAIAIETSDRPDYEALADHLRATGDTQRAVDYSLLAARQAAEALAFDRAARLYQRVLTLGGAGDQEQAVRVELAEALTHAGRGLEAAEAYRAARPGAGPEQALELDTNAALAYLKAGHMDQGLALLREVLASRGFRLAKSPRQALVPLLLLRARIRLRGLGFRPRAESHIAPDVLARVDLAWSAGVALSMVDTFRGAEFQSRNILLALNSGDTFRIARALCLEIGFAGLSGTRNRKRVLELIARARKLAEELERPELQAMVETTSSLADYEVGSFRTAAELARSSIDLLRQHCTDVWFEISCAELYLIWALHYLGELGEMAARMRQQLREAEEKGDLYAATSFRAGPQHIAWLLDDDLEAARRDAEAAARVRASEGFHLQSYWIAFALCQCDLYAGEGDAAYRRICDSWDQLEKVLIFRIQFNRLEALHLRARCAVAAAVTAADPEPLLGEAERLSRRVAHEKTTWASPLADITRAAVARLRGDDGAAARLLESAADRLEAADMGLHAAICRYRLATLSDQPGEPGQPERAGDAEQRLRALGIANPSAMARIYAPGL